MGLSFDQPPGVNELLIDDVDEDTALLIDTIENPY